MAYSYTLLCPLKSLLRQKPVKISSRIQSGNLNHLGQGMTEVKCVEENALPP